MVSGHLCCIFNLFMFIYLDKPPTDPRLTALSSLSVDEGDAVTLQCNLSTLGNPPIVWSWLCGDDDLTLNATENTIRSTLTFTANRRYNQEACRCRATSPRMSLSYNRTSQNKTITVFCKILISKILYI